MPCWCPSRHRAKPLPVPSRRSGGDAFRLPSSGEYLKPKQTQSISPFERLGLKAPKTKRQDPEKLQTSTIKENRHRKDLLSMLEQAVRPAGSVHEERGCLIQEFQSICH